VPPPPPPRARFGRDRSPERANRFKSVIAVLIGLVSLTGAVATWRAASLGSLAADTDRRSIIESVQVEKSRAAAEAQLRAEEQYFARYRANVVSDEGLKSDANASRQAGNEAQARDLLDQAQVFEELAKNLSQLTFNTDYITTDPKGNQVFDEVRRRRDLLRNDTEASRLDPDQTVAEADRLHARSQRMVKWIVAFVGIIVLLTIAQLSRPRVRPLLASVSTGLWLAITLVAFLGDKT
jgi:osmotically-inducible protein OsmY